MRELSRSSRRTTPSVVAHTLVSASKNATNTGPPPGCFTGTVGATSTAFAAEETRRDGLVNHGVGMSGDSQSTAVRSFSQDSSRLDGDPGHKSLVVRENTNVTIDESADTRPLVHGRHLASATAWGADETTPHPLQHGTKAHTSGDVPPTKVTRTARLLQALQSFWRWLLTPLGFLITIYGLNIVAWGGMLFLLLCNASPAMCWTPDGHGGKFFDCNNLYSPRRKWIEWDSQILNALFCVTGFGLAPWRFRDLYLLFCFRFTSKRKYGLQRKMLGLRKLAGHYHSWFRLPGSTTLDEKSEPRIHVASREALEKDVRIPLPLSKQPDHPLTGARAPPTSLWKVDFYIWCQVWNTFFQCCLSGFMWGMDRFTRPSWSTGLFVALACIVGAIGGLVGYVEGRKVKRVEGVRPAAATHASFGQGQGATLGLQRVQTDHGSVMGAGHIMREAEV